MLKLSLKQLLLSSLCGRGLLLPSAGLGQIVIKSPAVHKTAAARNFVRPKDPRAILRRAYLARNASLLQPLRAVTRPQ